MTPLEFITNVGDNGYHTAVGAIVAALHSPIVIRSQSRNWEVLCYYFLENENRMCIDIGEIK